MILIVTHDCIIIFNFILSYATFILTLASLLNLLLQRPKIVLLLSNLEYQITEYQKSIIVIWNISKKIIRKFTRVDSSSWCWLIYMRIKCRYMHYVQELLWESTPVLILPVNLNWFICWIFKYNVAIPKVWVWIGLRNLMLLNIRKYSFYCLFWCVQFLFFTNTKFCIDSIPLSPCCIC